MTTLGLLKGLRFIDSFFPSGGYAFSAGLEAAVQGGAVTNAEDLSRYVIDLLRAGMGRREAVTAGLAQEAIVIGVLESAIEIDCELDAMKVGRESRLASRQMGRQVIRIAADRLDAHPLLKDFRAAVEAERTPGHLPVSLGLTLGAAGWGKKETVVAFLYQTAVGLVSASLKLLPIGQREGQRLIENWLPVIEQVSAEATNERRLSSWSPVQDIYAMRHRRLASRLFRS